MANLPIYDSNGNVLGYQQSGTGGGAPPSYTNPDGSINWANVTGSGVSAIGSFVGANAQKAGLTNANIQQQQTYRDIAGIYRPQYQVGTGADVSLAQALGLNGAAPNYAAFENSPGYQFTLQQGDQAINRAAAASGNAFSSSTLAALDKYNTGLAEQTYQNYVGNLLNTAGLGNQAAAGMAAARYNTGANIGQGLANIGSANASGVQGATQALAGPLGTFAKSLFGGGGSGGGTPSYGGPYGGTSGTFGDPSQYSGLTDANGVPYFLSGDPSSAPAVADNSSVPQWFDTSGGSFNAAGGEAAGVNGSGVQVASNPQSTDNSAVAAYRASAPDAGNLVNGLGSTAATAGEIFGIQQGLQRGGLTGNAQAALSAGALANRGGAFGGASSGVGYGLGAAGGALGLYNGLQQGGVLGYGGATVGGLRLASGAEGLLGNAGAAGALGSAAGFVAAPLSLYSAVKNWQSGNTGNDALQGAEAGASIGSLFGPLGTLAGLGIGGAVGAASSLFGPGKMDPENTSWNSYATAYNKNPAAVSGASPAQNFQVLSGIFDSRGSNIPFYNQYGRMGENQFVQGMMGQVNSAIKAGKVSSSASPQQIYSQVVQPWITKMGGSGGWQNTYTSGGASEKAAVGNVLTNLIGQWQSGQITNNTALGINGQTLQGGVPVYGG